MSSGADGNLSSVVTAFLVGEHDPPYVRRETSFQAADRFVSGFAFSDLLIEIDAAVRVVAKLGDGCDVDGMVQDAVPTQIQTMPGVAC